jgi:glycosyltransferase involved in cell wall biosynthesis
MPYLSEAIESVIHQDIEGLEYIVIDGNSTDGSVGVIKSYEESIDKWISEPDNGIYDAMNKGISMANGDIIGILNADDTLEPGILPEIAEIFERTNADYLYGNVDRITREGTKYGTIKSLPEDRIPVSKYRQVPFPHPSLYVKKRVLDEIGLYDTNFKLNADYDFILRLLNTDFKSVYFDKSIARYRDGGKSSGIETFLERKRVWKKHGVSLITREYFALSSALKLLLYRLFPAFLNKFFKKFRSQSVQVMDK